MAYRSRYQPIRDEPEDQDPAWKKFFVILTGRTNGAHQSVVRTFQSSGQTETTSPEDADYCLVFCPIASRVGTDIDEAMEHLPDDKAAVLVVMHHTFDAEKVIPPSSRVVKDQRVQLTLDCLFYQNNLLNCQFNRRMEAEIRMFFRVSESKTILQWITWFLLLLLLPVLWMVCQIIAAVKFILDQIRRSLFRRHVVWFIIIIIILIVIYILYHPPHQVTNRTMEDGPEQQIQRG